MTATVHTLVIPSKRQDALAYEVSLQRLQRQNRQAEMRKEMLECITEAEAQVKRWQGIVDFGRAVLAKFDGGPDAA